MQEASSIHADAAFYNAYRLVRARRFGEAIEVYDRLLSTSPERAEAWINRGVALQGLYRLDEALDSFDTALRHSPDHAGAHINRGVVLGWTMRNDEALAAYNRALELEPDSEPGRLGRAVVLSTIGRGDEAMRDDDYVLARDPGNGSAHYNKALVLLSQGNYIAGFREHEWRFGTRSVLGPYRFKQPLWCGEPTDKTILVYCEQGLGDSIQFARYLPLMFERGLKVVVEAPRQLSRLFSRLPFLMIERDAPLPPFDLQCPMMSLAAIFETRLGAVPFRERYLSPRAELCYKWRPLINQVRGPRVGLSWSSGVRLDQVIARAMQVRKSIPRAALAPLLDTPGVTFVSLQKDVPDDGIPPGLYDPMPDVSDLADTAGIIANLDLVVTVDSAVAHLAGAMGRPVWVLNRHDICWRWLSGAVESPWYRSARIFRQSAPGRWDDVIAQVKTELGKL